MSARKGNCIHFNGIQNKCCEIGISYDSLTTGPNGEKYAFLLPCLEGLARDANQRTGRPIGQCDKYLEPTAEQIAAREAEIQAAFARHAKAAPVLLEIRKKYKGKSWSGVIKCPVCDGKLHVGIAAYNGHMRGRCETEGCLSWIE